MKESHNELHRHYTVLLGVKSSWEVNWVNLDETLIRARVKTMAVSWAELRSRFTLLLERFAVDVILAARSLTQAGDLLGLDWDAVQRSMDRTVRRGLMRREFEGAALVGIDEKSFRRGQPSISLLTDIDKSRVLEVMEGCDQATAQALWQSLRENQRQSIVAVAPAFIAASREGVPQAALRRQEHKELMTQGEETLKSTRQLWLFNPVHFSAKQAVDFEQLNFSGLKVARALAIKDHFSKLWNYCYEGSVRKFFKNWFRWAARSKLPPVIKAAKMIKRHLENILIYLRHPITKAVTKGHNSKIQSIMCNARLSFF